MCVGKDEQIEKLIPTILELQQYSAIVEIQFLVLDYDIDNNNQNHNRIDMFCH
jgi:hypothetical protein